MQWKDGAKKDKRGRDEESLWNKKVIMPLGEKRTPR